MRLEAERHDIGNKGVTRASSLRPYSLLKETMSTASDFPTLAVLWVLSIKLYAYTEATFL
jgi:hypothetical protein